MLKSKLHIKVCLAKTVFDSNDVCKYKHGNGQFGNGVTAEAAISMGPSFAKFRPLLLRNWSSSIDQR
jgi:hypothetical protein